MRAARCGVLLVQAVPSRLSPAGPEWEEIWRGGRPGDRTEIFVLYRRIAPATRPSIISTQ